MGKTVGVLGAGQMGNGIARVFAAAGNEVRAVRRVGAPRDLAPCGVMNRYR